MRAPRGVCRECRRDVGLAMGPLGQWVTRWHRTLAGGLCIGSRREPSYRVGEIEDDR